MARFDLDRFIADCRDAFAEDPPQKAVRELVARAVADPARCCDALGEPRRARGSAGCYVSPELTVLNVVWAPQHDDHAAQSPYVGGDRHLRRARGQHLLAPDPDDARRPRRGRGRAGARRRRLRPARSRHHPLRDQPDPALHRRAPRLWRRFLRRRRAANGTPRRCWRSPTTSPRRCACSRTRTSAWRAREPAAGRSGALRGGTREAEMRMKAPPLGEQRLAQRRLHLDRAGTRVVARDGEERPAETAAREARGADCRP